MYLASRIAVVTALGGCGGGMGSLMVGLCFDRHPDITQVLNGILGGLVSITAGADVMEPGFAILTGLIGGVIVYTLSWVLKVRSHSRFHNPPPPPPPPPDTHIRAFMDYQPFLSLVFYP